MKRFRKCISLLLVAVMMVSMFVIPGGNVQAAKKKVQLSKKTVTLEVGKKVTLKLKNAPKKKKITWSSNKKKIASVSKKGVVTAKKAGKANITAKVSGKKYVCKVTVKKKAKQDTPDSGIFKNTKGKNADDVAALAKIFSQHSYLSNNFAVDLNNSQYEWDNNGRLIKIVWGSFTGGVEEDMGGSGSGYNVGDRLEISGFTALKYLNFTCNNVGTLVISNNPALTYIDCRDCGIGTLDISKNPSLEILACSYNDLTSLNVSENTALTYLDCGRNGNLTSLDVSKNTALTHLNCEMCSLSSLDVGNNTELTYLNCYSNKIKSLDVSKNSKLTTCNYSQNDGITVTGWPKE